MRPKKTLASVTVSGPPFLIHGEFQSDRVSLNSPIARGTRVRARRLGSHKEQTVAIEQDRAPSGSNSVDVELWCLDSHSGSRCLEHVLIAATVSGHIRGLLYST
jgi:hypothetical protein